MEMWHIQTNKNDNNRWEQLTFVTNEPIQINNKPDLGLNVATLTVFKLSRISFWSLEPTREEKYSLTSEGKTYCLFVACSQRLTLSLGSTRIPISHYESKYLHNTEILVKTI